VGLDASGALSAIPFKINGNEVFSVTPDRFVAWHTNVGASLRGRLMLRLSDDGALRSIGLGGRIGYRYWGASAEPQVGTGAACAHDWARVLSPGLRL
jgi:hypothetical protein